MGLRRAPTDLPCFRIVSPESARRVARGDTLCFYGFPKNKNRGIPWLFGRQMVEVTGVDTENGYILAPETDTARSGASGGPLFVADGDDGVIVGVMAFDFGEGRATGRA